MKATRNQMNLFNLFLAFCGGAILLFVVAPLVGIFLTSHFGPLKETAADIEVTSSIFLTMSLSLAGTFLFAVLAIPFAYWLARCEFPGKHLVSAIIDLPVVIPHSAAGIALLTVLNRTTPLGRALDAIGLPAVDNRLGIMIAMAFSSVPFLINASRSGFEAVPRKLENAALTLGASPARVFFTISLPLAWRSILSGLVMMWARGLSEFGAVIIIAYYPMVTSVLIWDRFHKFGLQYAQPVAVLFLLVSLSVFIILRWFAGGVRHARP